MQRLAIVATFGIFLVATRANAEQQWLTLPPTPTLPNAAHSAYAPINGIRIWYATCGRGEPVVLLHGGLANANYWGNQVRELPKSYRVVVMDSRGPGRSTRNEQPYGYDLMAADVTGLMDFLKIPKAAIVGARAMITRAGRIGKLRTSRTATSGNPQPTVPAPAGSGHMGVTDARYRRVPRRGSRQADHRRAA
jgi:hypothetical protein